jgi:hypothetical protein
VVGYARSGTTLLAVALDRHPDLAATPETHFFDQVMRRARRADGDVGRMVHHLLACERVTDLGLDPDDLLARLDDRPATWSEVYLAMLALYADQHGAGRAVDKTPAHLAHVPRILRWYPDARVINLVRDGRDAVMSMMAQPFTHDDIRRHGCNWRRMIDAGSRFERRYPERFVSVRYEDLVRESRATLARIDGFLGVEFDPRQLDDSVPTDVVPDWERPWKAPAASAFSVDRVGVWRSRATDAQRWAMHAAMGSTLRRLGYGAASLDDCTRRRRLRERALAVAWRAGERGRSQLVNLRSRVS